MTSYRESQGRTPAPTRPRAPSGRHAPAPEGCPALQGPRPPRGSRVGCAPSAARQRRRPPGIRRDARHRGEAWRPPARLVRKTSPGYDVAGENKGAQGAPDRCLAASGSEPLRRPRGRGMWARQEGNLAFCRPQCAPKSPLMAGPRPTKPARAGGTGVLSSAPYRSSSARLPPVRPPNHIYSRPQAGQQFRARSRLLLQPACAVTALDEERIDGLAGGRHSAPSRYPALQNLDETPVRRDRRAVRQRRTAGSAHAMQRRLRANSVGPLRRPAAREPVAAGPSAFCRRRGGLCRMPVPAREGLQRAPKGPRSPPALARQAVAPPDRMQAPAKIRKQGTYTPPAQGGREPGTGANEHNGTGGEGGVGAGRRRKPGRPRRPAQPALDCRVNDERVV